MKKLFLSFMMVGILFTSGCIPYWILPTSFFIYNIHYGIKDAREDKEKEIQRIKNDIPIKEEPNSKTE